MMIGTYEVMPGELPTMQWTGASGGSRAGRASFLPRALNNAKQAVSRRKFRRQLLGSPHLFGEPAWDMLIELFIHACECKRVSMSELCLITDIPASSALRLVHRLRDKQMVVLVPDVTDGRRHFVELTNDTLQRVEGYFAVEERENGSQ